MILKGQSKLNKKRTLLKNHTRIFFCFLSKVSKKKKWQQQNFLFCIQKMGSLPIHLFYVLFNINGWLLVHFILMANHVYMHLLYIKTIYMQHLCTNFYMVQKSKPTSQLEQSSQPNNNPPDYQYLYAINFNLLHEATLKSMDSTFVQYEDQKVKASMSM